MHYRLFFISKLDFCCTKFCTSGIKYDTFLILFNAASKFCSSAIFIFLFYSKCFIYNCCFLLFCSYFFSRGQYYILPFLFYYSCVFTSSLLYLYLLLIFSLLPLFLPPLYSCDGPPIVPPP